MVSKMNGGETKMAKPENLKPTKVKPLITFFVVAGLVNNPLTYLVPFEFSSLL